MADSNPNRNEDRSQVQQIVERAVTQVLSGQLATLQEQLVARVMAELPVAASATESRAASGVQANLVQAVAGIHAGTTQKEILRALLDAGSAHGARVALFVMKSGAAHGWQSRGFGEEETVKDFSLDMSSGPAAHAYQNRIVTPGNIAEMDARFAQKFGGPANEQVIVLPLVLKDKVAALLYADGGADNLLDAASLELLVMTTSAWLEVTSLRKQAQAREASEVPAAAAREAAPAVAAQPATSFSDPFAGHSPHHAPAKSAPEPEPEAEPAAEVVEIAAHAAAAGASAASAPAVAEDPFASMSPEDADTHRKAQRFARLLVDEIKLYNQAKVNEGRRHKDLYDRLKADIEKSRNTFQKRYGSTAAASGDYFQKEVVRSLAEDDLTVMGASFRQPG
jgi:hypothetical protein